MVNISDHTLVQTAFFFIVYIFKIYSRGELWMQMGVLLGIIGVLAAIAGFLVYYIGTVLDSSDTERIDKLPKSESNVNT